MIRQIRRALAAAPEVCASIDTVPRRGYRLRLAVSPVATAKPIAPPPASVSRMRARVRDGVIFAAGMALLPTPASDAR